MKLAKQLKALCEGLHYSTKIRSLDERAGIRRIRMGLRESAKLMGNILNPNHPTPNPATDDDAAVLNECQTSLHDMSEKLLGVRTAKRKSKMSDSLKEDLGVLNGEPNLIPIDNSSEDSNNVFIINLFNGLLRQWGSDFGCADVEVSDGEVDVFLGNESTGEVICLTFFDEDGIPFLTISDVNDEEEETEDEIEAYDLSDFGLFDGTNFDFSKLDARLLDLIEAEAEEEDEESDKIGLAEQYLSEALFTRKSLKRKMQKKTLPKKHV